MNINKALDKQYEGKPLKEILKLPVSALEGVSEDMHKKLLEAFPGAHTIGDLAGNKFFKWAQAIAVMADCEG